MTRIGISGKYMKTSFPPFFSHLYHDLNKIYVFLQKNVKRKIRRKYQLRIQQDKKKKRREKEKMVSILFEERMCSRNEYAAVADSPEYLYIYVRRYWGMSVYEPITIVFLFDIERETVKYAVERDDNSYELPSVSEDNDDIFDSQQFLISLASEMRVSLEVIGESHFCIKEEMEKMVSWEEPDLPHIFDRGGWVVFLKNGKRKRRICIQETKYYRPFLWLFRFFEDIVELIEKRKDGQES